jgi:hypothetical protein
VTKNVKAKRIYEKWKVDYITMDKKMSSIRGNFDELFHALYIASVSFDDAYEYVDEAVAHHLPPASTAKYVWNIKKSSAKRINPDLTYKEWLDQWKEEIRIKALASFYELFPIENDVPRDIIAKSIKESNKINKGVKTDDELNEEDFYKSSKVFSRDKPFIFIDKED